MNISSSLISFWNYCCIFHKSNCENISYYNTNRRKCLLHITGEYLHNNVEEYLCRNFGLYLRGKSRILHFARWRLMAESGALRREREAPLRSGKKSGRTAFLRQNFRVDRFLFWTESVSDCFSMQTTLLTCQDGAGGGGADLLETGLLEIRPTGQLHLLKDLVLDLRLLVQLDKWGRVR